MDEHTKRLIEMIEYSFDEFRSREISLAELTSSVEGIGSGLDAGVGDELITAVNSLVGKLEHIHFMCQPEEQHEKTLEEIAKVAGTLRDLGGTSGSERE